MNIGSILKIVLIVVDSLVILFFLLHIVKGYKRGFYKTLVIVGTKLIPLIFIMFFAGSMAKSIINTPIEINNEILSINSSLSEFVQNLVVKSMFISDADALVGTGIDIIVDEVLILVVSIVLFIIVSLLTFIFISPLARLICRIFIPFCKKSKNPDENPNKSFKILGAITAGISYIVVFVLLFLPVYGIAETAQVVVNEVSAYEKTLEETKDVVNESLDGSYILKLTSSVGKNKNGKFGIAAKTFGARITIKTEYGKFNIIEELDNLGEYIPRALELMYEFFSYKNINDKLEVLTDNDIEFLTEYLSNSGIVKIGYPICINILSTRDVKIFEKLDINWEEVKNIDIQKDILSLEESLKKVLICAKSIDFNNVEVESLLYNDVLLENLDEIVDVAFNLNITDKFLNKILIVYLDDILEENKLTHLVGLIDNNYLKENLVNDFLTIVDVYKILDKEGIIDYFASTDEEKTLEITEEMTVSLEIAIEKIFNLKILLNHEKKLVQTAFMFTEFDSELLNDMLEENIDWHQELESVGDIVIDALKLIIVAKLDTGDFEALLTEDEVVNILTTIIDKAFLMQLADKYFVPLIIEYIDDFLTDNDYADLTGIITVDYLKNDFTNDFNILSKNYKLILETNILKYFENKEENPIEFTEEIKIKLDTAIKGILSMKLVSGNEKVFMTQILSFLPEDIVLDKEALLNENYNWSNELSIMADVLVEALEFIITTNFDSNNLNSLLENDKVKEKLPSLVDKVFTMESSEKYLAPILIDYLNKMCEGTSFEKFTSYVDAAYLKNYFAADIEDIFDVYKMTKELQLTEHFDKENEYKMDMRDPLVEEKFHQMLSIVLELNVINGHEEDFIKTIVEMTDTEELLRVDEINFSGIDWEIESPKVAKVVTEFVKIDALEMLLLDDYLEEENFEEISHQYGETFDAMIDCKLTKDFAFRLLNTLVTDAGYVIEFSEEQKQQIIKNTAVYEFDILTSVAKRGREILVEDENGDIDYSTVKGIDVTNLMIEASAGVVASEIMGVILNETLGPDGINMMPKDEFGYPKYDFTNPDVLREQAVTIGNSFDLFNTMQSVDMNNITTDNITTIVDNITSLGSDGVNNELVQDVIKEATGEEIVIPEDVNWETEASIVEDVLNEYEASTDKENFDINDYPQLKENVENSEVAKAILDYLGIVIMP